MCPGKKFFFLLLTIFVLLILIVSGSIASENEGKFQTLADFKGKRISMLSGTSFDVQMENNDVLKGDVNVLYQSSDVDSINSVLSGKSDALILDRHVAEMTVLEFDGLAIFPESVADDAYGYGFPKGSLLIEPFNAAMKKLMGGWACR